MTSRQYLLTMWEGGGTIPPQLGVARRLIDRGHRVHVLGDPTIEDAAQKLGCGFSPWVTAPHRTTLDPAEDIIKDWEVNNPVTLLARARDRFMAGPAREYAADTAQVIERVSPEVLLTDGMLFGAMAAAEARGLPTVALMPNIWMLPTPGAPSFGPGLAPANGPVGRARDAIMRRVTRRMFDTGRSTLNAARHELGLPPLRHFLDQVLGVDRILVLTSATFDYASTTTPANVRYVGPILDDPGWAADWSLPWAADDGRPLVLVALSSTFQDQSAVLRRIVDALDGAAVRAVVTVGQMLPADVVPSTENVAVVASAPHSAVLPHASAVVTHCGHGTTIKALAAGLPLVCVPMGRDQNDTAARVVHHGAGVRLRPSAPADRIRAAVDRVLAEDALRSGAAMVGAAIRAEVAGADIPAEIEAVTKGVASA